MEVEDQYFGNEYRGGISVRDKLAESAMIGLLSNRSMVDDITNKSVEFIAESAYELADAMIKQSKI